MSIILFKLFSVDDFKKFLTEEPIMCYNTCADYYYSEPILVVSACFRKKERKRKKQQEEKENERERVD